MNSPPMNKVEEVEEEEGEESMAWTGPLRPDEGREVIVFEEVLNETMLEYDEVEKVPAA